MLELSRQLVQPRDLRSSLVSVGGWLHELGRSPHFLGSMESTEMSLSGDWKWSRIFCRLPIS